jgi:hypothetical protein
MSITFRKACDEVHGYVWEWFGINGRRNVKNGGFDVVDEVLVLLTGGASFDVFSDPWPGSRPEVSLVDASDRFVSSGVTIQGSFVPSVHDLTF